jgi:hypothetical protein
VLGYVAASGEPASQELQKQVGNQYSAIEAAKVGKKPALQYDVDVRQHLAVQLVLPALWLWLDMLLLQAAQGMRH